MREENVVTASNDGNAQNVAQAKLRSATLKVTLLYGVNLDAIPQNKLFHSESAVNGAFKGKK